MLIKLFSVFFLYFLTLTFMFLYGTINVYGLGYGSQDTMNFHFFFKCLDEFFSTQSALYGCFKSFLSNVDFFAWSSIWLPSYHKLHIWLGYGFQQRFMVVNPGSVDVINGKKGVWKKTPAVVSWSNHVSIKYFMWFLYVINPIILGFSEREQLFKYN